MLVADLRIVGTHGRFYEEKISEASAVSEPEPALLAPAGSYEVVIYQTRELAIHQDI